MSNNYLQNVASYGNYARGATSMVSRQSGSVVVNSTGQREARPERRPPT
ncbi:MAG: hypothetical protein ABW215_03675 [Kibdelosporangium sp.]